MKREPDVANAAIARINEALANHSPLYLLEYRLGFVPFCSWCSEDERIEYPCPPLVQVMNVLGVSP